MLGIKVYDLYLILTIKLLGSYDQNYYFIGEKSEFEKGLVTFLMS